MRYALIAVLALLTAPALAAAGGPVNVPPDYRVDAIGNGTPKQGVARIRHDGEDWFVPVDQFTVFKRSTGGTSTVNGGDGIANVHEAISRNAQQILDQVEHPDWQPAIDAGDDAVRSELLHEIRQVDAEDMRVKRGEVNGDTLTLRVEDQKRSRGRPFIFGRDVDIDVSSLEESAEIAAGDDATLTAATDHANTAAAAAEAGANAYTDTEVAGAKAHAEAGDAALGARIDSERQERVTNDRVLASLIEDEAAARQDGDAATLTAANQHADEGDAATLRSSQQYTNGIAEELATEDRVLGSRIDYLRQDATTMHDQQAGQIAGLQGQMNTVAGVASANAFAIQALDGRVATVEDQVRELNFALDEQRQWYREAIAGATAIGMVQQDPSANGVQLSVGVGHFQGQSAGSVVVGTRIADRVYVNAGASYGAATTYGASATVRLGGDLFVTSRRR